MSRSPCGGDRVDPLRGQFPGERPDRHLHRTVHSRQPGRARQRGLRRRRGHERDRAARIERRQGERERPQLCRRLASEGADEILLGEGARRAPTTAPGDRDDQVIDRAGLLADSSS
jgi:hypothetical protein